jgi:NAD(P)-dependent dehydrogenase (short-subunit alcohol dehydrogenase family)
MGAWGWFWSADLTNGAAALANSLLSHIITAKHAARIMMRANSGLIVEVTENDGMGAGGNPVAQIVKLALKGQTLNMAAELHSHGVAVVAITPGFLRSEAMLEHFGVTEGNWRDGGKTDKNFLESESPLYVGRAVAALAQDPKIMKRTGQLLSSWELSREYKFTDVDGRRPDWGKLNVDFSMFPPEMMAWFRTGVTIQLEWLKAAAQRTQRWVKRMPKKPGARKRTRPAGKKASRSAKRR